jgi:hypothetical protein
VLKRVVPIQFDRPTTRGRTEPSFITCELDDGLKGRKIDYGPIRAAWADLSDAKIADYERALPVEWSGTAATVAGAIKLIMDARDNIDACLEEVKRVLS